MSCLSATTPPPSTVDPATVSEQVMIQWTWRRSIVYSRLCRNVLREVCGYLKEEVVFAAIGLHSLRIYTSSGRCCGDRLLSGCPAGSITTILSATEVFCTGSHPASTSACSVDLRSHIVSKHPPMLSKRNCPGVARVDPCIYVFGGYASGDNLCTCERFDRAQQVWSQLPRLNGPRAYFSPVVYRGDILLPDVCKMRQMVARFCVNQNTFALFSVEVPFACTNCVSFILDKSLYIIRDSQMWQWEVGASEGRLCSVKRVNYTGFSCTEVRVVKENMCWVDYLSRKLVQLDLETLTITVPRVERRAEMC